MLWEGRPLREIRDVDIRGLIETRLAEHLQLEYKGALYDDSNHGRREFLLDICMFANAAGGILLIGVPELRDGEGQPTGVPDPEGILGLEIPNPEAVLNAYDARVMEAIEERLPLESAPIEVGNGRRILAIRIPSSTKKPHSARHQGHTYFPSRRERQRYHLTVREIKDLVMRTASQLQQAEELLSRAFAEVTRTTDSPYLMVGMVPVFFDEFLVDVKDEVLRRSLQRFSRAGQPEFGNVEFVFDGLERRDGPYEFVVKLRRNGLLTASAQLPVRRNAGNVHLLVPGAIDIHLRSFVAQSRAVYEGARLGAPYVLAMMLGVTHPLAGVFAGVGGFEDFSAPLPPRDYRFPYMPLYSLADVDRLIRPFCDQAHQMFGKARSASFNADGVWIQR